ncbi:MAG: hypothetical protein AAF412_12680 [Pseudomonadota bacterium]
MCEGLHFNSDRATVVTRVRELKSFVESGASRAAEWMKLIRDLVRLSEIDKCAVPKVVASP